MSTFHGLVEEIPGISVDRFDGDNLKSSVYFLSHCHTDHMEGLDYNFFHHLRIYNKLFYCSHISKSFIQNKYPNLDSNFCDNHIIELLIDEFRIISYNFENNELTIMVCCISSGHCPGSVMFLFTFNDRRILYTGDFRINKEDFSKLKSLHYGDNTQRVPLLIDKIYLDTTFLSLNFLEFPTRADSSKELCLAVKNWIEQDPSNVVILEISALYGSEYIYMELFKMLNKKVHVKDKVYHIYSRMNILANCVTNVGTSTPIHACTNKPFSKTLGSKNTLGLKCRDDVEPSNILTIIPSVQKWARKDTSRIIEWDEYRGQTKNVCYSTHASYKELEAFILYFKPKDVFPCVCHDSEKNSIYELLGKIMSKININNDVPESSEPINLSFSKHKMFKSSGVRSNLISDDEEDS